MYFLYIYILFLKVDWDFVSLRILVVLFTFMCPMNLEIPTAFVAVQYYKLNYIIYFRLLHGLL